MEGIGLSTVQKRIRLQAGPHKTGQGNLLLSHMRKWGKVIKKKFLNRSKLVSAKDPCTYKLFQGSLSLACCIPFSAVNISFAVKETTA